MLLVWLLIFIASLALLVKSADWVVESSETIALAFKIAPFIVGVVLVALGTSLPELVTVLTAVLKGNTAFVVDAAFGSNIATILLVVGVAAVAGRKLIIKRSLIDLDAPLLSVSTVMIVLMVWDKQVVFEEGLLLLAGFFVYLLYTYFQRKGGEEETSEEEEELPSRADRRKTESDKAKADEPASEEAQITFKTWLWLIVGIAGLIIGSNYTVESVEKLGQLLGVGTSFLTITAVAVGTSLPELMVAIKAALKKQYEMALGNVFGSNVFTIFLIIGVPALVKPLAVDPTTLTVGTAYLVVATLLFVFSGISRKIHIWEGLMYLLIYVLFVVQFFGLF
ncbi:MAG: calcium/sodium antiporter [Candidatus Paceibacterota bacterium]